MQGIKALASPQWASRQANSLQVNLRGKYRTHAIKKPKNASAEEETKQT